MDLSFDDDLRSELSSLDVKTLKELSCDAIEKNELVEIIVNHDMTDNETKNIHNHKRREYPTEYSVPKNVWNNSNVQFVERIPYNIDGLQIYRVLGPGKEWRVPETAEIGELGHHPRETDLVASSAQLTVRVVISAQIRNVFFTERTIKRIHFILKEKTTNVLARFAENSSSRSIVIVMNH